MTPSGHCCRSLRALAGAAFVATVATGCTRYDDDPRVDLAVPPRKGFDAVDSVLEPHCGTLDCHGGPARNLRIYGVYGLRLDGSDVTGGTATTELEVAATYDSIVAVDPESLSAVFQDQSDAPSRWLVVRKARGLEKHEGGAPLPAGTPGDRCLVSWIAGTADVSECSADVFGPVPRDGGTW